MKNNRTLLQKSIALTVFSFAIILAFAQCDGQKGDSGNPYGLSEEKVQWMKEATINQLEGCRVEGAGGTWIHTPDGVGNYKSLWTRDFYYMTAYAGDLLDPDEIKASIYYLLNGQREDGCIPDRVNVAQL